MTSKARGESTAASAASPLCTTITSCSRESRRRAEAPMSGSSSTTST